MKRLFHTFLFLVIITLCCCAPLNREQHQSIPIISWGGIPANKADTLFALAKECGFDTHLGLYSKQENALVAMDAAERAGMGIIINFPQLKDSTESAVSLIRNHPALVAYHIKDEPQADDYPWLYELSEKIAELDASHPCYINLLPNWSWGVKEYADNLELFASEFDLPFYSFDNYPVIEVDGVTQVRPEWYRNLEEFSAMARRHGKPFWAFALAKSHSIIEPEVAHYPEPTLGHLRLQVFSNLLYGAQAIQYFNFLGIVDPATCEKKPAFDLIKQVNSEIRAYSSVFAGCSVLGIWHIGESIPSGTKRLVEMPHKRVKSISVIGRDECKSGQPEGAEGVDEGISEESDGGAVVALIENAGKTYLAVQNRSCSEAATLDITFNGRVSLLTLNDGVDGHTPIIQPIRFNGQPIHLAPGYLAIFQL